MSTAKPTLHLVSPTPPEPSDLAIPVETAAPPPPPPVPSRAQDSAGPGPEARVAAGAAQDLVARTRAGDAAAAEAIYRGHHENVRRLLWQLLGPDPELEDVVQQVFLAVADSLHRLAKPESLGSWIVGITLHTARREIRRRQRWRRHGQLGPLDLPQAAPSARAADHQRVARIQRILATLPAEERIVFVLRFAEGWRLEEIKEACGCSLATVKRRLQRARAQFRERAERDFWLAPLLAEEEDDDAQ